MEKISALIDEKEVCILSHFFSFSLMPVRENLCLLAVKPVGVVADCEVKAFVKHYTNKDVNEYYFPPFSIGILIMNWTITIGSIENPVRPSGDFECYTRKKPSLIGNKTIKHTSLQSCP